MSPIDRIPVVDTLTPLVVGILTSAPRLTRTDTAIALLRVRGAGPLWHTAISSRVPLHVYCHTLSFSPHPTSFMRNKAAVCEAEIADDQEREREMGATSRRNGPTLLGSMKNNGAKLNV